MSRPDSGSPVDFVVGADDRGERADERAAGRAGEPATADGGVAEEELTPPDARPWMTQRWTLIGAAVLLVAAALIARGVTGAHRTSRAAAASPAAPTVSATIADPTAPTDGSRFTIVRTLPAFPVRLPSPASVGPQPAGCPSGATCGTAAGLPDVSLEALRTVFPRAALRSATSLLALRPGRFGPDLVSRTFVAHAGSATITVHIRKPAAGDRSGGVRTLGPTVYRARVEQVVPGFTITVAVVEPMNGSVVAVDYLVKLANDDGLVSPQ